MGVWKVKDEGSKPGLGSVGYAVTEQGGAVKIFEAAPNINTWGRTSEGVLTKWGEIVGCPNGVFG